RIKKMAVRCAKPFCDRLAGFEGERTACVLESEKHGWTQRRVGGTNRWYCSKHYPTSMRKRGTEYLQDLFRQMDRLHAKIVAEVGRLSSDARPCGCGKRGRHLPTCPLSANGTGWDGAKLACCGSRHRSRHKR